MSRGMWIVIMALFAFFVAGVIGAIFLDAAGKLNPCDLWEFALGPLNALTDALGGQVPCPFGSGSGP